MNLKFHFFTVILLFTGISLLSAQDQKEWSLDNCINYALEHNLNIQKQDLTVSILKNNFDIARFDRLPSVSANLSGGTTFGKTFSQDAGEFIDEQITYLNGDVSTNVALFDGFRAKSTIKQRNQETQAATYDRDAYANDIALQIVNYYLQILYNREQYNSALSQLEITKEQIERSKELVEAGAVPKGDVLELKAQAANEKSQLVSYANLEKEARVNLKQAMNIQLDTLIISKPENINADGLYATLKPINQIYQTAIDHLPEVKAAKASIMANKEAIDIAKADYYPSLYLGASVSSRYNDAAVDFSDLGNKYTFGEQVQDYLSANVGLSLSIPIFNKFRTKYNVDNAKINLEIAKRDESLTLQNIYQEIERAMNDSRAAYENFRAAKESLSANKESFKYAEQRFNSGLINSVDYNLAKTNLAKAQVDLLNARYELIFKVKILDFYMGKELKL